MHLRVSMSASVSSSGLPVAPADQFLHLYERRPVRFTWTRSGDGQSGKRTKQFSGPIEKS
jgi:hypothetical protein